MAIEKKKLIFYEWLVFIAYGFFILMGLTWFIMSYMSGGQFNYQAFIVIALFVVQAYYKHKLANLIIGVLCLALSIFMLLQSLLIGKHGGFDALAVGMTSMSIFSIIMSMILMFSYTKLSFKDQ